MKYLLRNINLINIMLAAAIIFFADYMVLPFFDMGIRVTSPSVNKTTSQDQAAAEKPAEEKTPSPSDYMIIAEQNVFHPDRKIPVAKAEGPPLPKPEFVLYGTLMSGDLNVAYMEDKKSPQSTPGREKRQTALRIGDSMSGFTLKEINRDRVVMVKGEENVVVYIEDPQNPKTRELSAGAPATPPPGAAKQPPAAGPAATTPQPPPSRFRRTAPSQAQQGAIQQSPSDPDNPKNQFLDTLRQRRRPVPPVQNQQQ